MLCGVAELWKSESLESSLLTVNLHFQPDYIWNHLRDTHLDVSVRVFPERFNWRWKTHLTVGSAIQQSGVPHQITEMKKERSGQPVSISLCFLTVDVMWSAASCSGHCAFSTCREGLYSQTAVQNKLFLHVYIAMCLATAMRKAMNTFWKDLFVLGSSCGSPCFLAAIR